MELVSRFIHITLTTVILPTAGQGVTASCPQLVSHSHKSEIGGGKDLKLQQLPQIPILFVRVTIFVSLLQFYAFMNFVALLMPIIAKQ